MQKKWIKYELLLIEGEPRKTITLKLTQWVKRILPFIFPQGKSRFYVFFGESVIRHENIRVIQVFQSSLYVARIINGVLMLINFPLKVYLHPHTKDAKFKNNIAGVVSFFVNQQRVNSCVETG
jgi:hypothetical protein